MTKDLKRRTVQERSELKAEAKKFKQFQKPRSRSGKLRVAEAVEARKQDLKNRDAAKQAFGHKPI